MCKVILLVLVFSLSIAACGSQNLEAPTETIAPAPVPGPTLLKEIDLETQTGTAYTLDWSPDGGTLAVASGFEIALLSHDLTTTQTVLKPEGGALAVTWSPDQTRFGTVNGYRNRTIKLWDWDSKNDRLTLVQEIEAGSDQYGVFWSPDGKLLATLADDDQSTFQIWELSTWEQVGKFELSYANPLRTIGWSADASKLYGAGESGGQVVVFALNVVDGTVQEIAEFPAAEAAAFAFSPDEKKLALADLHGAVQIIDLTSGTKLTGFQSIDQPVDLAWNPDGSTLAILGYKTQLQLWRIGPART